MTRRILTAVAFALATGLTLPPAVLGQEIAPHTPLWTSVPTPWAVPLDGGPLRVTFVIPRDAEGEVEALESRIELRASISTFDSDDAPSMNAAVSKALSGKFDVAVICAVSPDTLQGSERTKLESLLGSGRGFVLVEFGDAKRGTDLLRDGLGLREAPIDLLAGAGSAALSIEPESNPFAAFSGAAGRAVEVRYVGARPPGQCLVPASRSFEFPALYENYLSLIARCIRWAARREPAASIASLAYQPAPIPDAEITPPQLPPRFIERMSESLNPVRLRTFILTLNHPAPRSYGLRIQLRYPGRGVQWSYDAQEVLRKDHTAVELAIPAGSGEYFVDAWLMDGLNVVDWYTEAVTLSGRPRIANVQIAPAVAEPNDRLRVSLDVESFSQNVSTVVTGSTGARGSAPVVIARMLDPLGRVAALRSVPVSSDSDRLRFDVPIADWLGPYGRAELYVTDGYDHTVSWWLRQTASYAGADVYIRQPRRPGLSWIADAPGGSGHAARGVRQRLALLGVDRVHPDVATRDGVLAADGLLPVAVLPAPDAFPCSMDLGENAVEGRRIRQAGGEHAALRPGLYTLDVGRFSAGDDGCSELFAGFLARRYDRIDRLNHAWQSDHVSWKAAATHEDTSLQGRADSVAFEIRTREAYRSAVQSLVRRSDPSALVGIPDAEGTAEWRIVEATPLDASPRPLAQAGYTAIRSSLPAGKHAVTYARWLPWFAVLNSANALWSRGVDVETFADDESTAIITAVSDAVGDVRAGYDILFQAAVRPAASALIVTPMFGDDSDSIESWIQLLESHLIPYEISPEHLLEDVDIARYKLAILPARTRSCASAADWLSRFREAGGALATDGAPEAMATLFAAGDDRCLAFPEPIDLGNWRRDERNAFDAWLNQAGIQRDEDLRVADDFRGLVRDVRVGGARVIGLLSSPEAKSTASVRFEVAKDEYLYAPRGDLPGPLRRASAHLAPGDAALFAVLPYEVTRVVVDAPEAADPGKRLEIFATVKTRGALPGVHVLHVRLFDPSGTPLRLYDRTIVAHDGHGSARIPLAYNEMPGRYRVNVRDVMTGAEATAEIKVR